MKVDLINYPKVTQQIKLTRKESILVGQLINKYHKGKTEGVLEQLKDIFDPYIEKKFKNTLSDRKYSKKDYLQELYLELFESFTKITNNNHTASNIVKRLNDRVPNRNEYTTLPNHITLDKLTEADHKKYSAELLFTSETPKGLVKRLIRTPLIVPRAIKIIESHLNGAQYDEIANELYISPQRVNQIYNRSMLIIKLTHNKKFRNEYFEKYPNAKRWFERGFTDELPDRTTKDIFDSPQPSHISKTEELPINKIKHGESEKYKINQTINIQNTHSQKEKTIYSGKSWSMSDIEISDILIEKDAIFKQSGIVNGNIKNKGLYFLTGVTKGDITNSGNLNLMGLVYGKIKNKGKIELSGIVKNNISNDSEMNITGVVIGNIINYGDLRISRYIEGNIYTYKDIDFIKGSQVHGRIVKLDDE